MYTNFIFTFIWWWLAVSIAFVLLGMVSTVFDAFAAARAKDDALVSKRAGELFSMSFGMLLVLTMLGALSMFMGW